MILPIVAFGDPVLRKVCEDIDKDYPELQTLIDNMFETMYNAKGVGLAAPQIGLDIRLFLVDSIQVLEEEEEEEGEEYEAAADNNNEAEDVDQEKADLATEQGIKKVFINAEIVESGGKDWAYNEGCLSIPGINEDVIREEKITIRYYDRDFNVHEEAYDGFTARVILHEYDHIEGNLFTDYLSGLKKRMLKKKLERISKGDVDVKYRMRFPVKRKR